MYYFKHFSTAFVVFLITSTYISKNDDLSVNKFEEKKFLTDSLLQPGVQKKCGMYILLAPDAISNKEANAIKIKSFRRLYKTGSLRIKLDNNEKSILQDQKVWGYQARDCSVYRNFNEDFLKMEENGSLIIYSTKSKGYKGRLKNVYYFSKTLQSPVFRLDRNDIAEQFKDNPCFLGNLIKRISWPNDYSAWDDKKSSFVIVEIMNECK